jgi:hypothetical protein
MVFLIRKVSANTRNFLAESVTMDVSVKVVDPLNQFLPISYAHGGTHFYWCVKIMRTLFALSLKEAELRNCSCWCSCVETFS